MNHTHGTLPLFARFIARTMGLHFTEDRFPDLEKKMAAVAKDAGYAEVEQYLLRLMSAPLPREQLETLARASPSARPISCVTRGATRSWKNSCSRAHRPPAHHGQVPQDLERRLLLGEEPYSIAILLSRLIPTLPAGTSRLLPPTSTLRRWNAAPGCLPAMVVSQHPSLAYGLLHDTQERSLRDHPRIRKMVRFEHLNLADDGAAPGCGGTDAVDIIFCRNVMLYFNPAQIEHTLARFHQALRDKDGSS